ncbi:MAG: mucoidy inhibitor MuiA family protein, partial [Bacteroidota bacterium]
MQKLIISFFLLFSLSVSAQENKINASSEVKKVTVFLTGAELNHEAKIKLKKGKNVVTFVGLSPRLDERSINLDPGTTDINVLYINTHTNYLDEKKDNEKIQTLKDSLEFYKDKLALLQFEQDALNTEKTLLFKNQSIGGQAGVSIAEVEKSADFYRKRSTEINQLIFKNSKVKVKLEKERSKYKKQLVELDAEVNPPTSDITVTLVANKDMEANMGFKYIIPTAGWTPKYDIRTEGTGNQVKLVYRAILFNNSGLDWKDIKIILSTASPDIGINIPQLSKWYLGNEQEAEKNNFDQYLQVVPGVVATQQDRQSTKTLSEVEIVSDEEFGINVRGGRANKLQQQIQFKKIEVDMLS